MTNMNDKTVMTNQMKQRPRQTPDMNRVVGNAHILFICLDALRYDVAVAQQENGGTPVLNRYGAWRKCQAPGSFTYPSHQAMFAGFLPVDEGTASMKERETLFFSEDTGMGRKAPRGAWTFRETTWIQGLEREGYDTYCIGGVSFFDKRTATGSVLPSYFMHSDWHPSFGCRVADAPEHQVDCAVRKLEDVAPGQLLMMYINFTALHYPTHYYVQGARRDSVQSQGAALRAVDIQLGRLFHAFKLLGPVFVICCSDHGTCFGEDGMWYHGIGHPLVYTVPYKHFLL